MRPGKSGRNQFGGGAPAPLTDPARPYGAVPIDPGLSGFSGGRSASFETTASQMQQQTMTDDDVQYYQDIHDDPPYDVIRVYIAEVLREMAEIEGPDIEDEPDEDVDEASVVANVAGYTGPLGAKGPSGGSQSWTHYARSFGNAKPVGSKNKKKRKKS